jgi:hypothetical protein
MASLGLLKTITQKNRVMRTKIIVDIIYFACELHQLDHENAMINERMYSNWNSNHSLLTYLPIDLNLDLKTFRFQTSSMSLTKYVVHNFQKIKPLGALFKIEKKPIQRVQQFSNVKRVRFIVIRMYNFLLLLPKNL